MKRKTIKPAQTTDVTRPPPILNFLFNTNININAKCVCTNLYQILYDQPSLMSISPTLVLDERSLGGDCGRSLIKQRFPKSFPCCTVHIFYILANLCSSIDHTNIMISMLSNSLRSDMIGKIQIRLFLENGKFKKFLV